MNITFMLIFSFQRNCFILSAMISVMFKLCFRARVAFDDSLWIKGVCISSIISVYSLTLAKKPFKLQRNEKYFPFSIEIFCTFTNADSYDNNVNSDGNNSTVHGR